MTWFISAFIIASAIFMFAPKSLATSNTNMANQPKGQGVLLLLPLLAFILILISILIGNISTQAVVAISFALTGCSVAVSQLHRFILPCAGLTAISLIAMLIQAI